MYWYTPTVNKVFVGMHSLITIYRFIIWSSGLDSVLQSGRCNNVSEERTASIFSVKVEAAYPSKNLVRAHQNTSQCNIPEDYKVNLHRSENLKYL
jgi:hypothetical protein